MRITIVEDNTLLAQALSLRLQDAGHVVFVLHDGLDASEFLKTESSDILILDINLPRLSGLDILQELRARKNTMPVLMLSARDEAKDRVRGLDLGADDYLVKPFDMNELEARIRVLARRVGHAGQHLEMIGDLQYAKSTRTLSFGDEPINLPRRELMLFECLILHRGRLVSKSQIAEHIFGLTSDADEKSVETYISRLRKKIAPYHLKIQTARGLGYMLQDMKNA